MSILNQPYPYTFNSNKILRVSGILFGIVFLFLALFQPFNVEKSEHRFPYLLIVFIQAGGASIVFAGTIAAFNFITKQEIIEKRWTVLKEIALLSFVFFCIGVALFFLRNLVYDNPDNLTMHYFMEELIHTFLIGFLITTIFTLTNTNRLIRIHKNFANAFSPVSRETSIVEEDIFIPSNVQSESFTLLTSEFLFAKADGNYVTFHLFRNGMTEKKLCRITLTQVSDLFTNIPSIVRTHRAYLVNTTFVKTIDGNAQGLQLSLEHTPEQISVSRGQISSFKAVMENT